MKFMKINEAIEGDYIETKNDNLFFDVKGVLHPNDRKICFLRFFPNNDGERIKSGISYKKIYQINNRFDILREFYPNYIFYSKELDLEIQGVKLEDIKTIHTPRMFYKKLLEKNNLSSLKKCALELCDLFIGEGTLSENSLGITGSMMVGLNTEDSDIDLIIYGTENSIEFQNRLEKIFSNSKKCRKYDLDDYRSHFKWRFGGSDINFEDFLKSEQRKKHQGKYNNRDFFIRYIKSPKDWGGSFYDYKYKNCGRIKLKAKIIDSEDSIFTPCTYKIDPLSIIEKRRNSNNVNIKDITEIVSFRGRYCEQARDGELILAEGKLEKVSFKNKLEYSRILLTDPTQDKMIII